MNLDDILYFIDNYYCFKKEYMSCKLYNKDIFHSIKMFCKLNP